MRNPLVSSWVVLSVLTLGGPSPSLAGDEEAAPEEAAPAVAALPTIHVAFKLDPRLSGPTYGGERWVSPPTYTGGSAQDTVEARASIDARGAPAKRTIDWSPSDPEMVTVTPPRGEQVKIAVKRAGESSVVVRSGGASRKLTVRAVSRNGLWQVSISQ